MSTSAPAWTSTGRGSVRATRSLDLLAVAASEGSGASVLSRFHIDHELELGRLFDAEFGELGASLIILATKGSNSVRVSRTTPIALTAWIAEDRLDEVLAASLAVTSCMDWGGCW